MKRKARATCQTCGNEFSGVMEFCPVCILRSGLGGGIKSGKQAPEDTVKPAIERRAQRFGHYELVRGDEGGPVELGRGGMGVTYRAIDLALGCPVALKVVSERCLRDGSARLRFLREARAAARVRHPNVASVFYLGKSAGSYFYAMEFVEGEPLKNLIQRLGRLELDLALKIASQVGSGLAALHKQDLVHRDIKPSNIMVNLEQPDAPTAKIIDLGLAKVLHRAGSENAISMIGSFVGTPEFASPEQFSGIPIDIRSDIYSFGVTLWQMLTGHAPFQGTPGELMHQHLHAALAMEQLAEVPQPAVLLLEILLEKNPARRFQNPGELLTALEVVTGAIERGAHITRRNLQEIPTADRSGLPAKLSTRRGPEKISVARLPVTANQVFGRDEDLAFLDAAWEEPQVNIVTVVAWAGVGKSTLVNHWLRRMAAEHYRSAQLVFGWSFYRQGISGDASSADEFLDATLAWFGDPDPRIGAAWEKGQRLANLVAQRSTLLILDGLEPLQYPPGPQEGRLREPSLQALLRELAAFNRGLCVITTRLPVADIADHEGTSARHRDLEHLTSEAGAQLLRAMGAKGPQAELRSASDQFRGHCLALTLLGSYLTDAYNGDIRRREEVAKRLTHDVRQGAHARKVMASYQSWFGEGSELSVLRILGFFDRPAEKQALEALLKPPAIPGLTESLTRPSGTEWRTVLARLRRARLLAEEDAHNPGQLDTHPLVREYFGEQLRSQQIEAWREGNRRLYHYYQALAPRLPDSAREMEPLFLAVTCGCHAGLCHEALHEVYLPRIQRGNASFAAKILGARGALLSALVHFFEQGRWGSLVEMGVQGERLTTEDQLFILTQAALYLTATRGLAAPEARICYERAEPLCHSLDRPLLLYSALVGQWRYSSVTAKMTTTLQLAKRIYALSREQNDAALMVGAYRALAFTHYYLGDFEAARRYARRGVQTWRSGGALSSVEEVHAPVVICLIVESLSEWHLGEIASCHATMSKAISVAKELSDMHALAQALCFSALLAYFERNVSEVEVLASETIELSMRHDFAHWPALATVLRGWARSASGDIAQGIAWIEDGIRHYHMVGSIAMTPCWLSVRAEALHRADRSSEAAEAITEAQALAHRSGERWWCAELYRILAVLLTATGAEEAQIETAFCAAIRTAKEQKSISLMKRAERTYAEYRRQKASGSGGRGFRLPLC
jgi:serine/threonine protein kinase/predicted ATPase